MWAYRFDSTIQTSVGGYHDAYWFDGFKFDMRQFPVRQASPVSLTRRSIPAYYGGERWQIMR
ncbi:hypothetical protein GCM10009000_079940 [Halobacterium noricense]|uniref:Uncharacterized protein n=1 Tax=Haladaptatus pallidirubidus TaxID=1008152 RepID=A0AAV3UC38_9EURY